MNSFKVVAITHKKAGLESVGKFHIQEDKLGVELPKLKSELGVDELMYLSTCNRVEFYISTESNFDIDRLLDYFLFPKDAKSRIEFHEGDEAVMHLFSVAASLDSMVVGEREIITQVRKAFELSRELGLTGDNIRLAVRKTIENAKRIFTETAIANNPVSVVSLAYRELAKKDLPKDSKILVIGAGQTNGVICRLLSKAGWSDITIFNRTLAKAEILRKELKLKQAKSLDELSNYTGGFDVLITCTGAEGAIITPEIYERINQGDSHSKVIIDLAIPEDIDRQVLAAHIVDYISVSSLKPIADKNLEKRKSELVICRKILSESFQEFGEMLKERKVERAMKDVPVRVKEIRHFATEELFKQDISQLDDTSREVLEKVLSYVEKKYISVPMKMAKEIILDKHYDEFKR